MEQSKASKPRIDGEDINTIVAIIEAWEGPLTWARLTSRAALILGRRFSRQALDAHSTVKIAYQTRKTRLRKVLASVRAGKSDMGELSPELALALQRAVAFQARGDRLQAALSAYDAKFVTWLYNARIAGISETTLNTPLPVVDRNADREANSATRKR
jgi:hypothetical protein